MVWLLVNLCPRILRLVALMASSIELNAQEILEKEEKSFINNIENNIGGGGGLIYGLKSFVQEKTSFISGEIDCALGSEQSLEIDFKIYPNPASKELFIQSSQLVKSLIVHDFYGKKIMDAQINSNSKQLVSINRSQSTKVCREHFQSDRG